jgi:hypothetical protein
MQNWKCKECWSDFIRYDTIRNICWKCLVEKTRQKPLFKNTKPIKARSSKNKNTIAKFSEATKKKIKARDIDCILCGGWIVDIHHIYYWNQANFKLNRNDIDQWVGCCRKCHENIHSCKTWEWERQKAIDYVLTYYWK